MVRALAASLLAAAALTTVPAVQPSPSSWVMYQARSDHNAVFSRPGFKADWVHDAAERINSGLSVVGDYVYFDTLGGKVVALDLRTGAQRWSTELDNVVMSTPVVAGGVVYVGTGHNGTVHKHDASFVYAADERSPSLSMWGRPEGDHLVALEASTGKRLWSYRTAGEDMPSPVLIDERLIFVNGDFNAYALRARDGTAAWIHGLTGLATMASANRVSSNALVSTCAGPRYRGETLALDSKSGTVRWRANAGDCDSAPTVGARRVFVSGVDGNNLSYGYGARGTVAALDAATGRVLWRYLTPEAGPYTKIGSNERAIAGCYANGTYFQAFPTTDRMVAFDADTGRVKWDFRTAAPVKMSAVVRGGRVYFGDTVGLFYTLDAATGKALRVRMLDAPFTVSPPVIVEHTILFVSGTKVYASVL